MDNELKKTTDGAPKIKTFFSLDNLPPLFGDNFVKGNINWKRLENVEFETLGRILVCHLLIETHLNKLLELRLPNGLDIDEANLSFNQKLKLMRNDKVFINHDFYNPISIVNKIRNKFSHNIEAVIEPNEIGIIESMLKKYNEENDKDSAFNIDVSTHTSLAIIETFTSLFCAYTAGYCSALTDLKVT
jgi:hypothetical protein